MTLTFVKALNFFKIRRTNHETGSVNMISHAPRFLSGHWQWHDTIQRKYFVNSFLNLVHFKKVPRDLLATYPKNCSFQMHESNRRFIDRHMIPLYYSSQLILPIMFHFTTFLFYKTIFWTLTQSHVHHKVGKCIRWVHAMHASSNNSLSSFPASSKRSIAERVL